MFRPVDRPLSFRQRANEWIYKVSLSGKNPRAGANAEFSLAEVFAKWVNREEKGTGQRSENATTAKRYSRHSGSHKSRDAA